jgi:hypothetical protein
MTDTKSDNMTGDLLRIHGVITRGLDIILHSTGKDGTELYQESLLATIIAHHKTEDEATFPYFRDKLPEVDFDELIEDHKKLTELIEKKNIAAVKELWTTHIAKEESYFTQEKLDELLTPEEQMQHRMLVGQTAGKHSQPPFLVMPFVIFNQTEDERKVFTKYVPPEVLNMVNSEWQEKWRPMEPLFYSP